jgi:hypothetical protein
MAQLLRSRCVERVAPFGPRRPAAARAYRRRRIPGSIVDVRTRFVNGYAAVLQRLVATLEHGAC